MSERNTNIWGFTGITGLIISIGLLLSILVVFTYNGIKVQQASAVNPYSDKEIRDINNLKKISEKNNDFAIKTAIVTKD